LAGLGDAETVETVKDKHRSRRIWLAPPLLLSLALSIVLSDCAGRITIASLLVTALILCLWGWALLHAWRAVRYGRFWHTLTMVGLLAGIGGYGWLGLWLLRPDLLPPRAYYDFVANRHVTERLVDPALLKVEHWQILDRERQVLFVHPAPSGSTALVYPVRIEPRTVLRADLAVAPQAWSKEGDGVVFTVYVEDEAGMHLLYSRYVDPKHHQADRQWLPLQVDLTAFGGKLVRIILAASGGPAGDQRYDWAGWGEARLERPLWP
jgi:hypothetical protein